MAFYEADEQDNHMALLFMEGFEAHGGSQTVLDRKYADTFGWGSLQTGRLQGSAGTIANAFFARTRSFGAATSTCIIGFGYQDATTGASSGNIEINIINGADDQLRLLIISVSTTTFRIDLMRGATVIAASADYSTLNWHYFELKAVIDPTAGTYELRRNETVVFSGTGTNTADSASANWDAVHFANAVEGTITGNPRMDDIYILDGTGTINNDFLGDSVIEGRLPTGDSVVASMLDWTPSTGSTHWDLLDDTSDTTLVSSGTAGDVDLLTFDSLSFITGTVHGVMTVVQAGLDSVGTRTIRNIARSNAVNYNGASQVVETTDSASFYEIWETDPDTAVKWTISGVNAAEFGFELVT
tara:strand:+ start:31672 stop:32742 length:1071 start_codon:yes stop_codon:yes gene_type:complete